MRRPMILLFSILLRPLQLIGRYRLASLHFHDAEFMFFLFILCSNEHLLILRHTLFLFCAIHRGSLYSPQDFMDSYAVTHRYNRHEFDCNIFRSTITHRYFSTILLRRKFSRQLMD